MLVKFGVIDSFVNKETVVDPILKVMRRTPMRDGARVVLLLTDGGSRFSTTGERFFVRCICRSKEDLEAVPDGAFIRLIEWSLVEHNGEQIVTTQTVQLVGKDDNFHPSEASGITAHPRNNKAAREQPPPVAPMPAATAPPAAAPLAPPSRAPAHPLKPSSPYKQRPDQSQQKDYGVERRQQDSRPMAAPYIPGAGAVSRTPDVSVLGINDLNAFVQRWTIKARVSTKGDIRKYNNARGEGQLMSVDLVDQTGEIRATFFNKSVDKFYELLDQDRVYIFSKGQVRSANKKFNHLNHSCELQFGEDASIIPADNDTAIPARIFNFVQIKDLVDKEKGAIVDVIGVVVSAGEISTITVKATGEGKAKRDVSLVDFSGSRIDLTLWSEKVDVVTEREAAENAIVCVKGAKVDDYQGKKIGFSFSSVLEVNPDIPQTQELRSWYAKEGNKLQFVSLSGASGGGASAPRVKLTEVIAEANAPSNNSALEKGIYFSNIVTLFRSNGQRKSFWSSCPTCAKKVQPLGEETNEATDGSTQYYCNACAMAVPEPKRKFILNLEWRDETDNLDASVMADTARDLVGVSVEVVENSRRVIDSNGKDRCDYLNFDICWREYLTKTQAKAETYNDERRIRYRAMAIERLNYGPVALELAQQLRTDIGV